MTGVDCPYCGKECSPASVPGGGRVAWFCQACNRLYPDGDYIKMESMTVGRPRH